MKSKDRRLEIRLSSAELSQIRSNAAANGFPSVSEFIRHQATQGVNNHGYV